MKQRFDEILSCFSHSSLSFYRISYNVGGSYKALFPHAHTFSFHLTRSEHAMGEPKPNGLGSRIRFPCLVIAAAIFYYMTVFQSSSLLAPLKRRGFSNTDQNMDKRAHDSSKSRLILKANIYIRIVYQYILVSFTNICYCILSFLDWE